MSPEKRDLASLKRMPVKKGQPAVLMRIKFQKHIKTIYIRGEISSLASQPGLPGQPGSYEH
jgi:hypothetical protein